MKPSISISTFKPKFAPITLQSTNIEEFEKNCKFAHECGYKGVDLFFDKKTDEEIVEIKGILDKYELKVSMLICIYLAEMGVNFTYMEEEKRRNACKIYIKEMEVAKKLGALTMPLGLIRGNLAEGDTLDAYYERLADSARELIEGAKKNNIYLCIEPINRYECNTLLSVKETVDFIKKYKLDGIYIVPDLFHMNIEDDDMCESLREAKDYVKHMHVSDSNRRAPGMGHTDYKEIFKTLKEIGYEGYLTLETLNFGETERTAIEGAKYINKVLEEI